MVTKNFINFLHYLSVPFCFMVVTLVYLVIIYFFLLGRQTSNPPSTLKSLFSRFFIPILSLRQKLVFSLASGFVRFAKFTPVSFMFYKFSRLSGPVYAFFSVGFGDFFSGVWKVTNKALGALDGVVHFCAKISQHFADFSKPAEAVKKQPESTTKDGDDDEEEVPLINKAQLWKRKDYDTLLKINLDRQDAIVNKLRCALFVDYHGTPPDGSDPREILRKLPDHFLTPERRCNLLSIQHRLLIERYRIVSAMHLDRIPSDDFKDLLKAAEKYSSRTDVPILYLALGHHSPYEWNYLVDWIADWERFQDQTKVALAYTQNFMATKFVATVADYRADSKRAEDFELIARVHNKFYAERIEPLHNQFIALCNSTSFNNRTPLPCNSVIGFSTAQSMEQIRLLKPAFSQMAAFFAARNEVVRRYLDFFAKQYRVDTRHLLLRPECPVKNFEYFDTLRGMNVKVELPSRGATAFWYGYNKLFLKLEEMDNDYVQRFLELHRNKYRNILADPLFTRPGYNPRPSSFSFLDHSPQTEKAPAPHPLSNEAFLMSYYQPQNFTLPFFLGAPIFADSLKVGGFLPASCVLKTTLTVFRFWIMVHAFTLGQLWCLLFQGAPIITMCALFYVFFYAFISFVRSYHLSQVMLANPQSPVSALVNCLVESNFGFNPGFNQITDFSASVPSSHPPLVPPH